MTHFESVMLGAMTERQIMRREFLREFEAVPATPFERL